MKLATYSFISDDKNRFGLVHKNKIIDIKRASDWANKIKVQEDFKSISPSLHLALNNWNDNLLKLQKLLEFIIKHNAELDQNHYDSIFFDPHKINLCPPIVHPNTFRDFYAFEQHVKSARKLRGLDMNPDWYKIPVFYFSNTSALYGHKQNVPYPKGTKELDFELEFAAIIANGGSNISCDEATNFIAGYTICNDWSARDFQRQEMAMNLGPAKGKDFATSFGPYLVTPDEIKNNFIDGKLHLRMRCYVNNNLISDGNTNDLYHPFSSMIERASKNTKIMAGDYFGSGTVGTGCILELRPENTGGWLKKGDTVRMEIEKLGVLENKIV